MRAWIVAALLVPTLLPFAAAQPADDAPTVVVDLGVMTSGCPQNREPCFNQTDVAVPVGAHVVIRLATDGQRPHWLRLMPYNFASGAEPSLENETLQVHSDEEGVLALYCQVHPATMHLKLRVTDPKAVAGILQAHLTWTRTNGTTIHLDASGSRSDVPLARIAWRLENLSHEGAAWNVTLEPGYHPVTLNVTDAEGNHTLQQETVLAVNETEPFLVQFDAGCSTALCWPKLVEGLYAGDWLRLDVMDAEPNATLEVGPPLDATVGPVAPNAHTATRAFHLDAPGDILVTLRGDPTKQTYLHVEGEAPPTRVAPPPTAAPRATPLAPCIAMASLVVAARLLTKRS